MQVRVVTAARSRIRLPQTAIYAERNLNQKSMSSIKMLDVVQSKLKLEAYNELLRITSVYQTFPQQSPYGHKRFLLSHGSRF